MDFVMITQYPCLKKLEILHRVIDYRFVGDQTTESEMLEPKSLKLILQVVDAVSHAEKMQTFDGSLWKFVQHI